MPFSGYPGRRTGVEILSTPTPCRRCVSCIKDGVVDEWWWCRLDDAEMIKISISNSNRVIADILRIQVMLVVAHFRGVLMGKTERERGDLHQRVELQIDAGLFLIWIPTNC